MFILPKKPAAVVAAGGRVSWDNTAHQCDAPGAGLYPVGVAVAAAGNGAGTVTVRLDGVSTAAA
ncbi:capsid cement protein [Azospirillum brasilense]|uniref:capsid cement protein n=1 Tax=Azospirillum brasilense TaxID=192 RepID=UPI001EDABC25|nr:capsid cement protein [Azospirillum brasilense]